MRLTSNLNPVLFYITCHLHYLQLPSFYNSSMEVICTIVTAIVHSIPLQCGVISIRNRDLEDAFLSGSSRCFCSYSLEFNTVIAENMAAATAPADWLTYH